MKINIHKNAMQQQFTVKNIHQTSQLAKKISQIIMPNFVIGLSGTLGAGKTTIIREILTNLGITGTIKSPTYTLVEPYKISDVVIYHFDLYRLMEAEEWYDCGFDEYFDGRYISFIEWIEKAQNLIPQIDWIINIDLHTHQRLVTIDSLTNAGNQCLKNLI